jgi:thioredoxin-related protein
MKYVLLVCSFFLLSFSLIDTSWGNNLQQAKQVATTEHKLILLNFSGSDWCGPCMRMHKEIFASDSFQQLAKTNLVLINADFPRQKKNQLAKAQQQLNDQMAEAYNKNGAFPLTVLLTADGRVLKSWEGFPKQGAAGFMDELRQAIHAAQ